MRSYQFATMPVLLALLAVGCVQDTIAADPALAVQVQSLHDTCDCYSGSLECEIPGYPYSGGSAADAGAALQECVNGLSGYTFNIVGRYEINERITVDGHLVGQQALALNELGQPLEVVGGGPVLAAGAVETVIDAGGVECADLNEGLDHFFNCMVSDEVISIGEESSAERFSLIGNQLPCGCEIGDVEAECTIPLPGFFPTSCPVPGVTIIGSNGSVRELDVYHNSIGIAVAPCGELAVDADGQGSCANGESPITLDAMVTSNLVRDSPFIGVAPAPCVNEGPCISGSWMSVLIESNVVVRTDFNYAFGVRGAIGTSNGNLEVVSRNNVYADSNRHGVTVGPASPVEGAPVENNHVSLKSVGDVVVGNVAQGYQIGNCINSQPNPCRGNEIRVRIIGGTVDGNGEGNGGGDIEMSGSRQDGSDRYADNLTRLVVRHLQGDPTFRVTDCGGDDFGNEAIIAGSLRSLERTNPGIDFSAVSGLCTSARSDD